MIPKLDKSMSEEFMRLVDKTTVCIPLEEWDTLSERAVRENWVPRKMRVPVPTMVVFDSTDRHGRGIYLHIQKGQRSCLMTVVQVVTTFGVKTLIPTDVNEIDMDSPFLFDLISKSTPTIYQETK